jgi:hypothetical protein
MTQSLRNSKVEYGDFQTPIELAEQVCQQLRTLGVNPSIILEPTCGVGHFIEAGLSVFPSVEKIIGIEINADYLKTMGNNQKLVDPRIVLHHGDFFRLDWLSLTKDGEGEILVLGNLPWVTNSQQGRIYGKNLPSKSNFQHHPGLDAITGKSNFDISEAMLMEIIQGLQGRNASLALLCKTSVARKILTYVHAQDLNLAYCATYRIDTRKYFGATVEACLLFCRFDLVSKNYCCDVFRGLGSCEWNPIGYENNILVQDLATFARVRQLYTIDSGRKWRSGIKHDCGPVMEFRKVEGGFMNGLGEVVSLEETYLFPLLKGSDVAQGRIQSTDRYVLVTQRFMGEPTERIKQNAPKTWQYLESHGRYLDHRKSRIYRNNPRFSMFGVGEYTFEPWKIAICGLYKKLAFRLVGEILNKPAIFDDTVYFLSFGEEEVARQTLRLLESESAMSFYSCLIFWDEKRPIKSSILNRLNLVALAQWVGDSQ